MLLHALRLLTLAAFIFAATPAPPACACSCASSPMAHITLAVRGQVAAVAIRDVGGGQRMGVATIAVSEVLRGPAHLETVRVRFPIADGMNCGIYLRTGDSGFFTAAGAEGGYIASMCTEISEASFRAQR